MKKTITAMIMVVTMSSAHAQFGNLMNALENAAKQIVQDADSNGSQSASTGVDQSNIGVNQKKIETLNQLAASLWVEKYTYKLAERQWNYNTEYGAPPISANYKKMISSEIPSMLNDFSTCSVQLGGNKINEATAEQYIMTSSNPDVSGLRQIVMTAKNSGAESAPVRVPKKKDLNDAANSEMQLRSLLNRIYNASQMKTNKNWCATFKP